MRAIIRWGIGLLCLLLAGSISDGYVWISPVTKNPLGHAPDLCTVEPYYFVAPDGQVYGPYFYLRPSFPPEQPCLPGPIGSAIQSGFLPHDLLMSKEAMAKTLEGMPLLKKTRGKGKDGEGHGGSEHQGREGQGPPPGYCAAPYGGAPYGGGMPPATNMQVPYLGQGAGMGMMPGGAGMPMTYPQQMPYSPPMAYAPPMPYPMHAPGMGMMPYGAMSYGQPMYAPAQPMPANRQVAYTPYAGRPPYMMALRDPLTGIWQVQNTVPNQNQAAPFNPNAGRAPMNAFMPIPSMPMMPGVPGTPGTPMTPMMPGVPTTPGMPMMPATPGMSMAPNQGFQYFTPMPAFDRFAPVQLPQPPQMGPVQMQMPRMDMVAPPPARPPISAYPTHPFVRSPRDFFMWGDNMADERARGNRPFPVP